MNTQTERPVRKPVGQRGKPGGNKRYNKQTAHVGARRDGKPLIFGWGAHLTHTEKVRLQRRATWTSAVVVFLILAGVLVGTWINLNIVIPGEAITTVNGHAIPQSEYRAMVAVSTQLELNYIYGPHGLTAKVTGLETQDAQTSTSISQTNTQISNLQKQIKDLPAGDSTQRTTLTNQLNDAQNSLTKLTAKHQDLQNQINTLNNTTIPNEKQNFTQSQYGNVSATDLQDDEVLREWLSTQSKAIQNEINPSATQVTNSYNSLNINMPTTNGYNTFLHQMISNDQIRAMLTILDRRTNALKYFSSQLNSPSYQVEARQIVLQTQAKANEILQDLQKGQDFAKLATQSQDSQTKTKGGDLGWLTFNQYVNDSDVNGPPKIENWLFDPARKVNETSPVIYTNGSYYIVQITAIDHSRAVDATVLKALKGNALVNWLSDQRAQPGQHITNVDQNKLLDVNNMPPNGILPSSPPASSSAGQPGTTMP